LGLSGVGGREGTGEVEREWEVEAVGVGVASADCILNGVDGRRTDTARRSGTGAG
jgi:hypothetical protein